ncbi:MAG TPA: ATPase, T2SS/T4P/T4SS family, partial [Candidatus Ozemobacteraceae bacterium]|nr:ATPase, T2SS/T4P/T4SS family [Candidatus Ozemobacteraceae bacterium]
MSAEFLKRKRIGEILIEMNAITPSQLELALKRQPSARKMIGEILIEDKAVTEETLFRGLSKQHGIEFVNLNGAELNRELIRQIPESLIKTYKFIPLKKEPKSLTIAVFDPSNTKMFDSIKLATGYMFIKWVLAMKSQIISIINENIYRPQNVLENVPVEDLLRDVKLEFSKDETSVMTGTSGTTSEVNLEELKRESDQTSIVTLVNKIILDAVKMRASDIHIEAFENIIQIRYRVDGILYDMMPIEKAAHQAIISRLKIMANLDITERI